jgi:aminocarboxymuconate-semialdehyde decarboxylase
MSPVRGGGSCIDAHAVELVGADRVLLGSDAPFDMADDQPLATVERAGLAPEAQARVAGANAAALFGITP